MNTATRIRQYLQINESATVKQLCEALDLSKADIHYHMRSLLKQGVVDNLDEPYQKGAGRPARQFILVKPAPETLSRLIISLLTAYQGKNPNELNPTKALGDYLAEGILENSQKVTDKHHSPAVRLTRIIRDLSNLGIHLRWLARKDGPSITVQQEYVSTLIKDPELVDDLFDRLLAAIKTKIG